MIRSDQTLKNNSSASETDIDKELWQWLDHARSALSRARRMELAQYGLTREQAALLSTLLDKGGSATIEEIADSIIRQYNSITTLVNRAAKMGLVKKKKSSENRKSLILITSRGKTIYQQVTFNSIKETFSSFNLQEKQQFILYLKRTTDKVRNILGMDTRLCFLS